VKLSAPTPRLEAKGDTSYTATTAGVNRTAGKAGWAVDPASAATAVEAAVRSGATEASVASTPVPPGTDPANLAGVDQLIGTFTTYHPCCAPRVTNIHLIAKLVDGTVVAPGKTFSLNEKVGERTRDKGFVPAPAIVDGELEDQLGGGVSQFSTTLFNAIWFAGLPSLKHQPHSKYISRYPPGREATLDWGNIDNVFRNDTDAPVVIRVRTTGTSVTVGLYGHTGDRRVVSETGPRNPTGDEGGFSVRVTRTVYDDGRKTGTATLRWRYDGLD
jgi:vancomycin resistance protein YoaR